MGVKKNIFYTSLLTVSNYIFPLIVYPYVSRVLGVDKIGLCNFIDSIINYFILFSMMGMSIIGTRQIAIDRANNVNLNSTFSSLMTLNGITTFIALAILIIMSFSVPEFKENNQMFFYGGIKLISNYFLLEWFYKGLEEFRYITLRTIIVKILYIVSVFILVKTSNDYKIYYLLTVLMVTINSVINTFYSRKFVKFSFLWLNLKEITKPFFIYGLYFTLNSLYTTFNIVYLGFVSTDTQVGYYTTATKLYTILLAFFTGITTVLMPRMSHLIAQNKIEEFKMFLNKSVKFLFSFSIPIVIFTIVFAPCIIYIISGPGYEGAIIPMRIIMPLMLIIGYEQIQIIQCLMPLKKDKPILKNSFVGAMVGIVFNVLLVPYLMSIGSAITWFLSESTIMILSQIVLVKYLKIIFPWHSFFKTILANIPLLIILLLIYKYLLIENIWLITGLAGLTSLSYILILEGLILKNSILHSTIIRINFRFKNLKFPS